MINNQNINNIETAIEYIKLGKPIVIADDFDRENEGDVLAAAQDVSPEVINFMITHARGLVCAPVDQVIAERIGLHPMVENNQEINKTAFTVSVDASQNLGVTTGVSAFDRAMTVSQLANPSAQDIDFVSPGHMFPLVAKNGGVLERNGHTEAAVDFAKLAGKAPAGVICEIIKPDGTMGRTDYLQEFAAKFELPFVTIADLKTFLKNR